jgi:hypothetical protein
MSKTKEPDLPSEKVKLEKLRQSNVTQATPAPPGVRPEKSRENVPRRLVLRTDEIGPPISSTPSSEKFEERRTLFEKMARTEPYRPDHASRDNSRERAGSGLHPARSQVGRNNVGRPERFCPPPGEISKEGPGKGVPRPQRDVENLPNQVTLTPGERSEERARVNVWISFEDASYRENDANENSGTSTEIYHAFTQSDLFSEEQSENAEDLECAENDNTDGSNHSTGTPCSSDNSGTHTEEHAVTKVSHGQASAENHVLVPGKDDIAKAGPGSDAFHETCQIPSLNQPLNGSTFSAHVNQTLPSIDLSIGDVRIGEVGGHAESAFVAVSNARRSGIPLGGFPDESLEYSVIAHADCSAEPAFVSDDDSGVSCGLSPKLLDDSFETAYTNYTHTTEEESHSIGGETKHDRSKEVLMVASECVEVCLPDNKKVVDKDDDDGLNDLLKYNLLHDLAMTAREDLPFLVEKLHEELKEIEADIRSFRDDMTDTAAEMESRGPHFFMDCFTG